MRQHPKLHHRQQQSHSQYNLPGVQQLSQNIMDIPLKKTKHINQILQLQAKQQKILQRMDSKPSNSKSLSQESITNRPLPTSATQKLQLSPSSCNPNYIIGCIMRSFSFRKLSIEDIAAIFNVKADLVEQIDKLRILSEFQGGQKGNPKLEAMRSEILGKLGGGMLQNSSKNSSMERKTFKELRSQFPKHRKKRTTNPYSSSTNHQANQIIQQQQPTITSTPNHFPLDPTYPSTYQHTSIPPYQPFLPSPENDIFQYQRLLRNKPPCRLDDKIIALVEIQKNQPGLTQKEILSRLQQKYGIKDMNQASISRYIKKIYEMKSKVDVILKAEKEGWVVL